MHNTTESRGCQGALSSRARPRQPIQRARVLVVLSPDGWCEAFAESHIDVRIVTKLDTPCEALAEDALECRLPLLYRTLYIPQKCRAVGRVERTTAQQRLDTLTELEILHALQELGESVQLVSREGAP